jgi:lipoate-protein ligase A
MARDEALLEAMAEVSSAPVLRLYGWSRPCLSLGYAQPYYSYVDPKFCQEHGVEVVRRPTGGRAVLHHFELTYAVVFRSDDPVLGGNVIESFRKVSSAILGGLRALGIPADLEPVHRGERPSKVANCFVSASTYEVSAGGRKLVGSAQVRRRGAVLQHGSILLDVDAALWRGVFADGSGTRLSYLVTLKDLGFTGTEEDLRTSLVSSFASLLGAPPLLVNMTSRELGLASRFLEKHLSQEWIMRR